MSFEMDRTGLREDQKKYVFVCGMPRSGTTIIAKEIARLPKCTGFENTGVIMDEGQYLQDVYPTEWACGGPGRFGFDSRSHLTENSRLLTPSNVARLRHSWEPYWDKNEPIRIEKTPGNLLKTRFLQAVFPNAYFIVIQRHPVAVSLATQKWSRTPLHDLFRHWVRCYEIFDEDKKRLEHLYELRYEDYVNHPDNHVEEIAKFIGTEYSGSVQKGVGKSYNKPYFDRWVYMLQSSRFSSYYRCVAGEYQPKFALHGYSLLPSDSQGDKFVRRSIARLLYMGADVYSPLWRADLWLRVHAHRIVDRYCPPRIRALLFPRRAKLSDSRKQPASA